MSLLLAASATSAFHPFLPLGEQLRLAVWEGLRFLMFRYSNKSALERLRSTQFYHSQDRCVLCELV